MTEEPDAVAWEAYPHHHEWFSKLYVAERAGHICAPGGVPVPRSGYYCVRPIINLAGMGVGATCKWMEKGQRTGVPPGFFWCEWFEGPHLSVTYDWNGVWEPQSVWEGFNSAGALYRFHKWEKRSIDIAPKLIGMEELSDVETINVEFIDGNIIEVHLRESPDPGGTTITPVWADDLPEGTYLENFDDGSGFLPIPRLGFIIE